MDLQHAHNSLHRQSNQPGLPSMVCMHVCCGVHDGAIAIAIAVAIAVAIAIVIAIATALLQY